MAMENAAQGHTTVDEEEVAVELNWQFGDSNNSVTYYRRGGSKRFR
jgi:hypothetical protein